MARSKISGRWLREHANDPFVKRARLEGYRSRAAYKLLELQQKDRLLRPGDTVVDLGAAPGGWSQVAAREVGAKGLVVALDLLPMDGLAGVEFIQGDFCDDEVLQQLWQILAGRPVDLVLSDMAPNISGIKAVDQPRGMYLAELTLDFACQALIPGGGLALKAFQGAGFEALLGDLRRCFKSVAVRKPGSSRARSPELYLVARNYRSPKSPS
ncbi:MAG: RlmE family RNA methyltransferase [Candidatus Competibacterales bacterium]